MVKKSFNVTSDVVMKDNVDIEDAIEESGHGNYNYLLLAASCIITIGATSDMLGYGLIVPAASCDLEMSLEQGGIVKSISFAGFLFGLPWGYIADTKGRKNSILICSWLGFIISTLTSFSSSFLMMLILKFLSTSFSTAAMTLATTYLGECTIKEKRNSYIFIQSICNTLGDLNNFVLGYFILPLEFSISVPFIQTFKSWRLCSLLLTAPLGVGAVMMCFLKESPKFLANKGDNDKAMDVLRIMFKSNKGSDAVYPVNSLALPDNPNNSESGSFWDTFVNQTLPIFKPPLLWRSLQLFLLLSVFCATNNAFLMWFPTMVDSLFISVEEDTTFCQKLVNNINKTSESANCFENNTKDMIFTGLILCIIATVLHVTCLLLANWRRTLIFTASITSFVGCIALDMFANRYVSLVLFCMIIFTGLAIGSVYAYYVDIYPTSYRGLATGLGTMVGRVLSFGAVALVGTTILNHCNLTFYGFAVFVLSGIIAAIFLPREESKKKNVIV